DYARAEKFMSYNVNPLVYHTFGRVTWMSDGSFWYRDEGPDGTEFIRADPAKGSKAPAFDHARLAAALSAAEGKTYDAHHLPLSDFTLEDSGRTVIATVA